MDTVKKMGIRLSGIHNASCSCSQGLFHSSSLGKREYIQNLRVILINFFADFVKSCFLKILRLHLASNLFHASPKLLSKAIPNIVGLAARVERLAFQYLSCQLFSRYILRVCIFAESIKTTVAFLAEPQLNDFILDPDLIFLDAGHKIFSIRPNRTMKIHPVVRYRDYM